MEHYPTVKEFEIKSVRIRMEARREAQSDAWEAILRTAGGHVDFDRDDLLALENRAQAEFDRARAKSWLGILTSKVGTPGPHLAF